MKKTIAVLLVLTLLASCLFSGCFAVRKLRHADASDPTAAETVTEPETEPEPKTLVNADGFTAEDAAVMGNWMQGGMFIEKDGWVYGPESWLTKNFTLTEMLPDGTGQSELTDVYANQMAFMDDWLYFLAYDHSTKGYSVRRIRTSGEDEQILVPEQEGSEQIMYMFLCEGYVYYAINDESADVVTGRLVRCDPDGGNPLLILSKPVYLPYCVGDSILFQDDNDAGTLHRCDPDGQNDVRILDCYTYDYVCDGKSIYYKAYEEDLTVEEIENNGKAHKLIVRKCDLNGENREDVVTSCGVNNFNLVGDKLYYVNSDDQTTIYVHDLTDGTERQLLADPYIPEVFYINGQIWFMQSASDFSYVKVIGHVETDGTGMTKIYG
ncbi:MAG: DUF5050 domain-containing protein [Clostridia bacterium]|nr:DUF5050 domain-containing protein [Clostridia bacterium]